VTGSVPTVEDVILFVALTVLVTSLTAAAAVTVHPDVRVVTDSETGGTTVLWCGDDPDDDPTDPPWTADKLHAWAATVFPGVVEYNPDAGGECSPVVTIAGPGTGGAGK